MRIHFTVIYCLVWFLIVHYATAWEIEDDEIDEVISIEEENNLSRSKRDAEAKSRR